jgi:hypothetical protein
MQHSNSTTDEFRGEGAFSLNAPSPYSQTAHILKIANEGGLAQGKSEHALRRMPLQSIMLEAILVLRLGISQRLGRFTYVGAVAADLGAISTRIGRSEAQ